MIYNLKLLFKKKVNPYVLKVSFFGFWLCLLGVGFFLGATFILIRRHETVAGSVTLLYTLYIMVDVLQCWLFVAMSQMQQGRYKLAKRIVRFVYKQTQTKGKCILKIFFLFVFIIDFEADQLFL